MNFNKIISKLIEEKKTIATMESCTGGGVANAITNTEGASEVLQYSAVTYSNFFKIKMGVDPKVIDQYSVYSMKTADEMSFHISKFADSNYGIGITGKLNRVDVNNPYGPDNVVFISIYDRDQNIFYHTTVEATKSSRKDNKGLVISAVIDLLDEIL